MFLLIDFDDIGDGLTAGIGIFLKIFFTLGILGLIYVFVGTCDVNIFVRVTAAISLAMLISNILTIIEGAKYLKWQKKKQEEKLYSEKYTKKVKNSLTIVTIATIILFIIGYFINFKFGKITIKGIASASIFTFFFNIIFCYLLNSNYIFEKKEFKTYTTVLLEFLKGRLLGQVLPIFIISLVIISLCCTISQNFDDTNFVKSMVNKMRYNVSYYNNQYEKYRNGKSIKELTQNEINHIIQDLSENEAEIDKLSKIKTGMNRSELVNKEEFLYQYLITEELMKEFNDQTGIKIGLSTRFKNENYNNLFILTLNDDATGEPEYYKFDLKTKIIGDKFENKIDATKYLEQIKQSIKSEK